MHACVRVCVRACVCTFGAGGLGDWAGSLHGLKTDPADKKKFHLTQSLNIMISYCDHDFAMLPA